MATILIIDDRAVNREFLSVLLGYAGHQVLEAENGAVGLEIAHQQHPDLVITDLLMPVMGGYTFVEKLRLDPILEKIPVVFYTATYRMQEARALAENCGIQHIISKPCEPQEILNIIKTALQLQDVTLINPELAHQEERMTQLATINSSLTTLTELSLDMSSERDPARLFNMTCRGGVKLLNAHYAAIAIFSKDQQTAQDFWLVGREDESIAFTSPNIHCELFTQVLAKQYFLCGQGITSDPKELGLPASCAAIHSFLGVSIITPTQHYGLLYFINKLNTVGFSKHDEHVAITLADKLAINYENMVLYQEIGHRSRLLEQEIQHRAQVENTLRQSEQTFRQFAESIEEVFWMSTPNMKKFIYVSPLYEEVWQRSIASLYQNPKEWLEAVVPTDYDKAINTFLKFSTGEKVVEEYRIVRPDGAVRWIYARGFPVFNDEGKIYRIAGIAEDITERKQLEDLAFQHKHHLELAELARVNSMGEMASTLAHELTQPLTSIATFTQGCIRKLQNENYSNNEVLSAMKLAAQQAERAGNIIHHMKNFIRKGELLHEIISINIIITNLSPVINYEIRNSAIYIRYELADSLPLVIVDKIQIEQVLLNLIRNAVEAMQEVKVINPQLILSTEKINDKMIAVNIIDNGPGLEEDIISLMFNPYISTKPTGMGMGLAISRTIIEAHGGQLSASCNSAGSGACFQFTLPTMP